MILLKSVTRIFLLFAFVAFIASCATKPPRTSSEIKADKAIGLEVTQQLANDQNIYARHIEVDVYRGVVTLSGFVFEANDMFEAAQVAARVPGVISVSNQMHLEEFGRGGRR